MSEDDVISEHFSKNRMIISVVAAKNMVSHKCAVLIGPPCMYMYVHRVPKKEATKLLPITFSNLNRFSKFFHGWIEDEYFQQNCVIFSTTP